MHAAAALRFNASVRISGVGARFCSFRLASVFYHLLALSALVLKERMGVDVDKPVCARVIVRLCVSVRNPFVM